MDEVKTKITANSLTMTTEKLTDLKILSTICNTYSMPLPPFFLAQFLVYFRSYRKRDTGGKRVRERKRMKQS